MPRPPAGRRPLTLEPWPCTTGCGRTVGIAVGDQPREPVRCDPCRALLGPRPSVRTVCDRDGCDRVLPKVCGVQRRRWELGRPVYCSPQCRTAATSWVESCGHCRKPMLVNRKRASRSPLTFCSRACSTAAQRKPHQRCARCNTMFRPDRPDSRFCSRKCGARGDDRVVPVERVCPVCGDRAMVHPREAGRPCSRACSNRWRTMPDWQPKVR